MLLFSTLLWLFAACSNKANTAEDDVMQPQTVSPTVASSPMSRAQPTLTPRPTTTVAQTAAAETTSSPPPSPTATVPPTITPSPTPDFPKYMGDPLLRDELGIQIHIHREDLRTILRQLQALGVGWVKVQVSWKLYQPHPDAYAEDLLAELDRLVEAAANNNLKVLLNVSKAPEWSRPTTELDGPPLDYGLYRDFLAFLAGRYQGNVAAYELWNEPNLKREWNGIPLSAAELTRLIAAGAEGIRQSDS
ncbi:MAG: cellulase family glycosylhydrolase, partial [Chloroflexota bacterium]